jgi:phage replication initiation protein
MNKANVSGGYSNTPLPSAFIEKRTLEKQVQIDWLSATFDFVKIEKISKNLYELKHDQNFQALLYMLGYTGSTSVIPDGPGKNGYSHSIRIGEHIELFYGSEQGKNKHGNYTMNLKMSGEACREYENHLNGNFQKLFKFLISYDHTKFTRVDYAIDDYTGHEINIYDIEHILRSGHYSSAYRKVYYFIGEQTTSNQQLPIGFTIQLGSIGSNQLVIYDKKLEQLLKEKKKVNVDTWFRYEMRFTDDKAMVVIQEYIASVEENNSSKFMIFASELLLSILDLKVPSNNKQKSRWKTRDDWMLFLNAVSKIDLTVRRPIETTIQKRKDYYFRSYSKFMATLLVALDNDDETFNDFIKKVLKEGLDKIDQKEISMINNYRQTKKLNTFEDVKEFMRMLEELDGDDDD